MRPHHSVHTVATQQCPPPVWMLSWASTNEATRSRKDTGARPGFSLRLAVGVRAWVLVSGRPESKLQPVLYLEDSKCSFFSWTPFPHLCQADDQMNLIGF